MKVLSVKTAKGTVEMSYQAGFGYSVYGRDNGTVYGVWPIASRQEADEEFLWHVGYPEWRAAADKAYEQARDKWLAEHTTIASVRGKGG
mgnify:CR=1 FL=1